MKNAAANRDALTGVVFALLEAVGFSVPFFIGVAIWIRHRHAESQFLSVIKKIECYCVCKLKKQSLFFT